MDESIVEVKWIDASVITDNLPLGAEIKPLERLSVGYLLHRDDDYIELTFGFIKNFHNSEMACEMKVALPMAMVKSIRFVDD